MASSAYAGSRPERPPAARPAPRGGGSRIKWDRVGRIALVLVLVALLYSYLKPALNLFNTYRVTTVAKEEFHRELRENKRLHHAIQTSADPALVAAAARKQGMVAEGETPVVMRGLR